ncbi:MAG: FAD binding domain-containing protein [Peptococcaceae bacterium]|nr:FAD binding domain-containing protein [Peptococcaceae bacterium]
MIPFDFIYCRPDSLAEADEAFKELKNLGKNPVFYAGGSEIITMSRAGSIRPGAVIDIKKIPECILLSTDCQGLTIGSACTLNQIKESKLFPLLTLACGRIADHTNQCRITLGGNLCGTIIYRETSLPLLVSDATVTIFGSGGLNTVSFQSLFQGRIQLSAGEFIVQLHVPKWALYAPHFHVKRTTNEKIDYPLVSMAAIWQNNDLRIAFSGICSSPFRSLQIEAVLNDLSLSCAGRAEKAVQLLPEPAYSGVEGSGKYRIFVLQNMLQALLEDSVNGQI